jgi:ArsR family transcriptional regulator, arsenate/arsenite/antimonite-responsive transcriptional repressor
VQFLSADSRDRASTARRLRGEFVSSYSGGQAALKLMSNNAQLKCFDTITTMKSKDVVAALAALAQETRLNVYRLLVQRGESGLAAGEIAASLAVSPATLSFHLKELSHAGLVKSRQEGRFVYYSADFAAMTRLLGFLTENCCGDGVSCGPAVAGIAAPRITRRRQSA